MFEKPLSELPGSGWITWERASTPRFEAYAREKKTQERNPVSLIPAWTR
jgi:hypothetical protein